MNYSSSDEARYWAENLAYNESEAFEIALKKLKSGDNERLAAENAELRFMLKEKDEQIRRLREALTRQTIDHYEYE